MNKINMTQIDYGWMFIRTDFQTKSSFFNNDDVIYFRLQNFALTHQNIIDLTHLLSYIDDIHMPWLYKNNTNRPRVLNAIYYM